MNERIKQSESIEQHWSGIDRRDGWQLDRRVPVALLILLLVQFAGAIWWCAKSDSKEELDAAQISGLVTWKEVQGGTQTKTESRLAVIEEKLGEQSETLHHIDDRLEKMLTPPSSK